MRPIPFSGVPAKTGKPKIPSNKYKLTVSDKLIGKKMNYLDFRYEFKQISL